MFLKYLIFGVVIFLVVMKVPSATIGEKDNLLITLVSVAVFILLELTSGWFTALKEFLCGCSSTSSSYRRNNSNDLVI
jgi:hypothetical protein